MLKCDVCRFLFRLASVASQAVAIVFLGIAICTPNWRYAHLKSINENLSYGLWEYCIKVNRPYTFGEVNSPIRHGEDICSFKSVAPTQNDMAHMEYEERLDITNRINKQEYFRSWEKATLALLSVSVGLALFGLVLGLMSLAADFWKYKLGVAGMTIVWCVLSLVGCVLAASAIVFYLRTSFSNENRFVFHLNDREELEYGNSYNNCVIGVVLYAASSMLSLGATIIACMLSRRERHVYSQVRVVTDGKSEKISTF